jgi:GTP-binding protein Era
VGRPNVGKSTLLNALVDSKVAITSEKPQTTRHAIRGVLTHEHAQLVFVDTPGLQKPRHQLGKRMNVVVAQTLAEVDICLFMLDASSGFGSGDSRGAREVMEASIPAICVINKADKVQPPELLRKIEQASDLADWTDVLTTSAKNKTGLRDLVETLTRLLPEGPRYYEEGTVTDQSEGLLVSERIREKILDATRKEVPHSVAVVVDEISKRPDAEIIDVVAIIYTLRPSQRGILLGKGGSMIKQIGIKARKDIEELLGGQIFLDLKVKVEPHWQRDAQLLERMGY